MAVVDPGAIQVEAESPGGKVNTRIFGEDKPIRPLGIVGIGTGRTDNSTADVIFVREHRTCVAAAASGYL
jgi:hypothetical protein